MKHYDNVPENLQPLGAWTYFWLSVLYGIFPIGTIFLIIHCFSNGNINRRSYARSFFCGFILVAIIFVIFALVAGGLPAIFNAIQGLFNKGTK